MTALRQVHRVAPVLAGLVLAAGPAAAAGSTIIVAENFSPRANFAIETEDAYVLTRSGCMEALTRIEFDGTLQPGLATKWTQSAPDSWDFTLRPGVTFADGQALTAAVVVADLGRALKATAPARTFSPKLVKSVEAVDAMTVRITTPAPSVITPFRMAGPSTGILSPAAFTAAGVNPVKACTGPFTITEVVPQQLLRLERNAGYWGGPAAIEHAEFRFVPDADVRFTMVRSGEAHVGNYLPASVKASDGARIVKIDQPRVVGLYLNNQKPPFNDVKVRQAVQAAIDTQLLSSTVYEGVAQPAVGPFLPAEPWAPQGTAPVKRDLDRARALLAEAGIKPGQLKIALLGYTERAEFADVASVIQSQLFDVGIDVDITIANYSAIEPSLLSGDFQATLLSRNHLTDIADPIGFLSADYGCKGSYNLSHFCDPAVDAALDKANALTDPAGRYAIYADIAARLQRDAVDVFLVREAERDAVSPALKNFQIHPLIHYLLTNRLTLAQ